MSGKFKYISLNSVFHSLLPPGQSDLPWSTDCRLTLISNWRDLAPSLLVCQNLKYTKRDRTFYRLVRLVISCPSSPALKCVEFLLFKYLSGFIGNCYDWLCWSCLLILPLFSVFSCGCCLCLTLLRER